MEHQCLRFTPISPCFCTVCRDFVWVFHKAEKCTQCQAIKHQKCGWEEKCFMSPRNPQDVVRFNGRLIMNGGETVSYESLLEIKSADQTLTITYQTLTKTKVKTFVLHSVQVVSTNEALRTIALGCGDRVYTWRMAQPIDVRNIIRILQSYHETMLDVDPIRHRHRRVQSDGVVAVLPPRKERTDGQTAVEVRDKGHNRKASPRRHSAPPVKDGAPIRARSPEKQSPKPRGQSPKTPRQSPPAQNRLSPLALQHHGQVPQIHRYNMAEELDREARLALQFLEQAHIRKRIDNAHYQKNKAALLGRTLDLKDKDAFILDTPQEKVTRYWYEWADKRWMEQEITVQIDHIPFSEGSMRVAYKMLDLTKSKGRRSYVAKVCKEPRTTEESYFVDAEMQASCQALADAYNANSPPKKVRFLEANVIRRYHKDTSSTLMAVEQYIDNAKYQKYNNNYGYVKFRDRNTPQAFSHFTYEYTRGKMLVVDLQGVGDVYTDPQVHTADGRGFGMGNWGIQGINKFFETHVCNKICRALGLSLGTVEAFGTMPVKMPCRFRDDFCESKFSRILIPVPGTAYNEDLALLGLNPEDFNAICIAFGRWCSEDYSVDASALWSILDELGFQYNLSSIFDVLRGFDADGSGRIKFMDFLKWYTGIL